MPGYVPNMLTVGDTLIYSTYYAPRGRQRLYLMAAKLSQRYLYPNDLLIGVIGAEGAGKSTLIKGLFPGMELTNDDDGMNVKVSPIYGFNAGDYFSGHTFHLDARYELAFKQKFEIVEAINNVIQHERRVVIEHFDLIYEALGYNAQVIFGIGEEVIVARPSVFGPFPAGIKAVVDKTIKFRKMAHSAEDLTSYFLERDYNIKPLHLHSDVKHGFVIRFPEKIKIDIADIEKKVLKIIGEDRSIQVSGEDCISFGDIRIECTGVRTHVKSTGLIEKFRLLKKLQFDHISKSYLLVGMVGDREIAGFENISNVMETSDGYFSESKDSNSVPKN